MFDIHSEPGDELRALSQLMIPDVRMKHFVVHTEAHALVNATWLPNVGSNHGHPG